MRLDYILKGIDILRSNGNPDIEISDIASDSRKCGPGCLFIAIDGFESDGHDYIGQAVAAGAAAVVYSREEAEKTVSSLGVVSVRVQDSRSAAADIAGNFFGHPSRDLNLVGVTGTNGKTTIATLLYRLFSGMGYCCGLLSTIANYICGERFETSNTTQDPITINRLLRMMADRGCEYCFMEVSSHALHQGRVRGLRFRGAIFTNITHDHLDYHKTFSEYIRCKKLLFDSLPKGSFALVNSDDRNASVMVQNTRADIYRYSEGSMAEFKVRITERSLEGYLLSINGTEVWTRFIGDYNAHNICAVYGAAVLLGADKEETLKGISAMGPVQGRMEYFKCRRDITAVVDYAHTPDALENVLRTLREISSGAQLVAVFGCGGNRDRTKRPEMAAIGAKYADRIVITSDNPRFEKPESIIEDMKQGLDPGGMAKALFITDRREAIRTALMTAQDGAIVLVAGKGHEDYQIVNGVKSHFDDKEIIQEAAL
ncbi:MAG TPA: UDP-N-acetylmuramoyl-L-alanyl-D-glutamate--2,6-diaminopimelate ligase [Candidatus Coprenecus stercoravium]|uniref:UDP-N-acetylmuramoyl-L-alanyl-D-glutamate--2,6-diaminopimelate ligase n=1 Tax=Candidatus Coprenecus stercoravium TaxID=2840735 RepID=A0A9D2GR24_9BACT|nr:UDP-N-acetylmuramoyl-L-alanyl-D-glutamate--2,6-diaminopimelate ligase [Candidatus Coprenecus stercoravium]